MTKSGEPRIFPATKRSSTSRHTEGTATGFNRKTKGALGPFKEKYAYETARLAHESGIANAFVTNGYLSRRALETLHPLLDAAHVDLKAFRVETYRTYDGARRQPALETMKLRKQLGLWLEVTTLVIPNVNDNPQELQDAAEFVVRELDPETPWHISRFFPDEQMAGVGVSSPNSSTSQI